MSDQPRFCKTCRYARPGYGRFVLDAVYAECVHASALEPRTEPVMGIVLSSMSCRLSRESDDEALCGPAGRFWTPLGLGVT